MSGAVELPQFSAEIAKPFLHFLACRTKQSQQILDSAFLDNQLLYQHGSERGYEAAPADQVSARV
jgi:hypothetical protein